MLVVMVVFQVDNDARLPVVKVIADGRRRSRRPVADDLSHLCRRRRPNYRRRRRHRPERDRAAAPASSASDAIGDERLRLGVGGALVCEVRAAPSARTCRVSRTMFRLFGGGDASERVGERRLERVVGERVQERVDSAIGVSERRKELEQVHLVRGERNGNADHHVHLQQSHQRQ